MTFSHLTACSMTVRIFTADYVGLINRLHENGITLSNIQIIDELTIDVRLSGKEFLQVKKILNRRNESYKIIKRAGLAYKLNAFIRRPVLLIGAAAILFLILYTPSRILFVEVKGNQTVERNRILESAASCGIRLGASRKLVRSEKVKNMLISQIPELQWVGVNTDGCVATIHVAEKTQIPAQENSEMGVSSIIASRDGVILACTVLQGTPLCKTGQAVKQGETLVSGYTDCGFYIRATRAKAEILAQTIRAITAVAPEAAVHRGRFISSKTDYSIRVGKNLINFRKYSGIPDATCVKMYEEKHLILPGGFILPVSLVAERCFYYEAVSADTTNYDWLPDFASSYLKEQMVAGQIIRQDIRLQHAEGLTLMTGEYNCTEIIGQTKHEEILENYGDNGTNG